MSVKRVVFIRHAQSEENVKFQSFVEGIKRLRGFRLPRWRSVMNGVKLLRTSLDSDLSALGERQVDDMRRILAETRFLLSFNPDLVVHSPLRRAKKTLLGVLPNVRDIAIELECLREATPWEHVVSASLQKRCKEFVKFLKESSAERIVVCGHSRYFQALLKTPTLFRNVDVWAADLVCSAQGPVAMFDEARLLHRSLLAPAHVMDADFEPLDSPEEEEGSREGRQQSSRSYSNVFNDLDPNSPSSATGDGNEPMCRICQGATSDDPEPDPVHGARLIRPCNCAGSLAFVHLACLNRWRSTSTAARTRCDVCLFEYQVRRSSLADLLMSDLGAQIVTALLILLLVFASGFLLDHLCRVGVRFSGGFAGPMHNMLSPRQKTEGGVSLDLVGYLYSSLGVAPGWRHCSKSDLTHLMELSYRAARADHAYRSGPHASPSGIWFWPRLVRAYARTFGSWKLMNLFFCSSTAIEAIDQFCLGLAVLGLVGLPLWVKEELLLHDDGAGMRVFGLSVARLALLALQVTSWWNGGAMGRLGLFVGVVLAVQGVYRVLLIQGRRLALSLGETIQETRS